eukprot:3515169-Amphidinium_carterae.1
MLRRQLHAVEGQMLQEGRTVNFREVLALSIFAKNATLMIGHHSPFMAVYGRPASLLPPFEEIRPLQVADDDQVRLREVATQAIINE